jgi:hypothetical protein
MDQVVDLILVAHLEMAAVVAVLEEAEVLVIGTEVATLVVAAEVPVVFELFGPVIHDNSPPLMLDHLNFWSKK